MKLNKINTVNFGGTDIDRVKFNGIEMWNAWTYAQGAPPLILPESIGKPLKKLYAEGADGGTGDLNEETGKYDVPITVRGKNLLRRNRTSTTASGNGTLVAKNSEITINSTAEDGNMGVEYDEATSATLTPGTYTFTYKYISGTLTQSKNALWLGLRKSDNNWFNNANGADAFGIRPNNYKTTMTCKYNVKEETKVCVGFVGGCIAENFKLSYQLEKGASATPYEPYQEKTDLTVSLDAPLHSGEGAYINAKIPTVKGTTIIEVNTSVPPAALKTYYRKGR